ncbi:hypothetical protein BH10ACT2_BH10ACT2_24640 [soil metagenome]
MLALTLFTACGDDSSNFKSSDQSDQRDAAAPIDTTGTNGDYSISAGGEATDAAIPTFEQDPQSTPIPDVITDPSRKLIITMTVSIEVTQAANAVDQVIALAARHGGQLYDSQLDLNDPKTANGDLVFKLPPDEVQAFLNGLDPAIGRRTGLDGTTSDVTTQIADLDAQMLAAEASVDRIRLLLEGAKTLDDVIRLEIEFTTRQTHLEQLRAQQNTLGGLVALATITVHLTTAPATTATVGSVTDLAHSVPDKGIGGAFTKGWEAFLTVLVALALFVGYTAPFLVLGGLALLIAWRVGKRVARNRPPAAPHTHTQTSAVDLPNHPTPVS